MSLNRKKLTTEEKLNGIENLLNHTIGASYYKRYIGAIFWNNISTPINLAITLMSAVNTGQATTGNLISDNTFLKLSIATLILTSINTFFRPNEQMNINNDYSRKWIDFGTKFEEIYLSDKSPEDKYEAYYKLNQDIHSFENAQTINQNCFIDIIYKIVSISCLNGKQTWFKVSTGEDENPDKMDIEIGTCTDKSHQDKTIKTDTVEKVAKKVEEKTEEKLQTKTVEKVVEKFIPAIIPDTPYSIIYPERAFVTCIMDDIPQPDTSKNPKFEILQEIDATTSSIEELNEELQNAKLQHQKLLKSILSITAIIEHENMTYDKKMQMEEEKKAQETTLQELSNIIEKIEQKIKNIEIQTQTPTNTTNSNRIINERNIMFKKDTS